MLEFFAGYVWGFFVGAVYIMVLTNRRLKERAKFITEQARLQQLDKLYGRTNVKEDREVS